MLFLYRAPMSARPVGVSDGFMMSRVVPAGLIEGRQTQTDSESGLGLAASPTYRYHRDN
jgi:hypothetical protein